MKTGVSVADAMTQKPVTISPEVVLKNCAAMMKKGNIGSLIIKDKNKLQGILTEWDVVRKVVADGKDPNKLKASDVMVKNLVTISPNKDVYEAIVKMRDNDIRHLPVVKDNKLIGFLTLKDILKIQPELFDILCEVQESGINLKGF